MKTLSVPIPEDLPPTAALVLFDVLQNLTQALWDQYEPDLLQLMMAERNQASSPQQTLDFDDDLPFSTAFASIWPGVDITCFSSRFPFAFPLKWVGAMA